MLRFRDNDLLLTKEKIIGANRYIACFCVLFEYVGVGADEPVINSGFSSRVTDNAMFRWSSQLGPSFLYLVGPWLVVYSPWKLHLYLERLVERLFLYVITVVTELGKLPPDAEGAKTPSNQSDEFHRLPVDLAGVSLYFLMLHPDLWDSES